MGGNNMLVLFICWYYTTHPTSIIINFCYAFSIKQRRTQSTRGELNNSRQQFMGTTNKVKLRIPATI